MSEGGKAWVLMRASANVSPRASGNLKGVWFAKKGKFWFWVRDQAKAARFEGTQDPQAIEAGLALGGTRHCIVGLVELPLPSYQDMIPDWPRVRWFAWIDGPRGLCISGATMAHGKLHELCAYVSGRCRLPCGHLSFSRLEGKRVIRSQLAECLA